MARDKSLAVKKALKAAQATGTANLWNLELKEIPRAVFGLNHLEHLVLSSNLLRVIPEEIRSLTKLKTLKITLNPIEHLPRLPGVALHLDWDTYVRFRESIDVRDIQGIDLVTGEDQLDHHPLPEEKRLPIELQRFPNLRELYIGLKALVHRDPLNLPPPSKGVKAVIHSLGRLPALRELTFYGVELADLPFEIRSIATLQRLNLVATGLARIPDWLGEMRHLTSLSLGRNELTELPASLCKLADLEYLNLSDNAFASIPDVIFELRSLQTLSITRFMSRSGPGISHVPDRIVELARLRQARFDGQPITTPPPEVVQKGIGSIRNYWLQQQESGSDYLCEAKLLIVGEPGAGKTSLAKKLCDPTYKLQPAEPSTEGMEILRWQFPAAIRTRERAAEQLLNRPFGVNTWDFGGQEIYHATHQFFLTRRSLYVLVADDRREDTDFYYWLNVVDLLSDGSPLLVVHNEKQDRQRAIDLGSLRARFPNLKEVYRTNLETNRGLEEIRTAIQRHLESLPHVGVPLPRTWKLVREALESDPRDHISREEYLAVCERHGFKQPKDKLQLSGYLHDLGICLHFQDDPVLKHTVIIRPKWGTDAVYRLLDDRAVIEARGRFGPADLTRVWSEERHAPKRDELLRLMMKFQLCYELPDGTGYVAPQLLSPTPPVYAWDPTGNLTLRYDYEFMPKGLITRFIVSVNHLIQDQRLVWRSGVLVQRGDTVGEIVEDALRKRITVRTRGGERHGLLTRIDDAFERIHRTYPQLRLEKVLPCSCESCRQRSDPFDYPLTDLLEFARTRDAIQCRKSKKLVDAAGLVHEAFPGLLFESPELVVATPGAREPESSVYVSYAWSDDSDAIVDELQETLEAAGIRLRRDRSELRYKDSIRDFMRNLGKGRAIVVVVSKKYLESPACMFELTEIASRTDLQDRIFPIVMKDAQIHTPEGRMDYVEYWQRKTEELERRVGQVGAANLGGLREDLDLYTKIRATVSATMDFLATMNALTPAQHIDTGFDELIGKIKLRLED